MVRDNEWGDPSQCAPPFSTAVGAAPMRPPFRDDRPIHETGPFPVARALVGCKADVTGAEVPITGPEAHIIGLEALIIGFEADIIGSEALIIGFETNIIGSEADIIGFEANIIVSEADIS